MDSDSVVEEAEIMASELRECCPPTAWYVKGKDWIHIYIHLFSGHFWQKRCRSIHFEIWLVFVYNVENGLQDFMFIYYQMCSQMSNL